jgi:beta-glucosidase
VKHTGSKVSRPELELKGFKRVHVPAGQTTVVEMPLTASSLMYWDDSQGKWRLERDTVTVMIGSSSEDIRLSKVITVQ